MKKKSKKRGKKGKKREKRGKKKGKKREKRGVNSEKSGENWVKMTQKINGGKMISKKGGGEINEFTIPVQTLDKYNSQTV